MADKNVNESSPPINAEKPEAAADSGDPELDQLLDSALEDFEKPHDPGPPEVAAAASGKTKEDTKKAANLNFPASPFELPPGQEAIFDDVFNGDFMDDATKQFEEAMKQLLGGNPEMLSQIEKLSSAADNIPSNGESGEAEKDFVHTLQDTLGSLAENAQNMQSADIPEDDLMRAMASMGLDGGEGGESQGDFMPMMKTMMQSLLSKDVLYPSLKEIADKYPEWLSENKDTITKPEYERYNKQLDIMKTICTQFEQENPDDTDDIKTVRFEKILQNMQAMQECGQPPKDITGEMAPGLEFDESGLPKMPAGMGGDQCAIM